MSDENVNYYSMLNLDRSANEDEIKRAYRREALKWHPDKHGDETRAEAEIRFKLVSEAYEVLKDPQRRAAYDAYGVEGIRRGGGAAPNGGFGPDSFQQQPFFFHRPEDVFREFFGGRDPFESFFSGPMGGGFASDPFFNRGPPQRSRGFGSGFGGFDNDPFFSSPFSSFGAGGPTGLSSFGAGGPQGFSSSSSSFYRSSSFGGGMTTSKRVQITVKDGKQHMVTTSTDASGRTVTEKVVTDAGGNVVSRETSEESRSEANGGRRIESSVAQGAGVGGWMKRQSKG
ncbi:dnaJ-like protein subfamily B member 6-like protein [Cladochytrium replicatum]|nr:dnaJ-like protein subfamily B member 6-like protein [Cladochytrium replicatum]